MTWIYALSSAVSLGLLVYLIIALVKPEKF